MPLELSPKRAKPLLAMAVALICLGSSPGRAADSDAFVISDSDGYGISECMRPGMDCGRVIADAWCESHGHGHASAFGLADDVTGSTQVRADSPLPEPVPANAVIIRCGE